MSLTTFAAESPTQVALITTGGTIAVALIGALVELLRRQHNAIEEVRSNAQEARDQVANTHSTNLRDDLDELHEDVREVLRVLSRHTEEIGGLRDDLRQERRERLAVADRLDDHITSVA
ncbi:hypothetical protein SEA_OZZYJ_25 [Streptomyces phage OzzyJ]|uniref:Membrane protein n=1 Tax=Streptomyces phage Werner TaxID=2801898 RepID=A0A7U0J719_9CAUD|nr:membrane protein [Streptomyces phage Werner]AVE00406.1 hypothetical protein SEA_OZZYJ_25 [Streptomyces phage OzzyJ]QAY17706.1 hypothetical protein SEA_ASTEN_24 [Streptomyces phage Asten]QFP95191.1 membrane protein [Streptomyces phage Whatever]QQO39639.1 membrane protein [Streptomyces phage Hippo]QQO39946.1 membrane protein [Streptomyces phage Dwayne]QYW07208.1 minor tail protein [Streptomyces phage Chucky]QYW07943.1 membrane protein [Streptomyces phage Triste]QZE11092.1 membrane protein 